MSLPKILQIINGLEVGGAETLLLQICKSLHKKKFIFHVCALQGGPLEKRFQESDIPLTILDHYKYSPIKLIQIKRLIKNLTPSIIHTHLFHAGLITRFILKKTNSKVVSTEHNTTDFINRNLLFDYVNKKQFLKNDFCIAVSKIVYDLVISQTSINAQKVKIIYPGIDIKRFPVSFPKKLNPSTLTLGTISRLSNEKGVDILLKAFYHLQKNIPYARLEILGTGNEEMKLKVLAAELGISSKIIWHGYQKDILPFLRNLDCYIQPSRHESFGITVLEAMAAKIPVIASNIEGLKEIIQNRKNGILFESENTEDLSEKVLEILKNQALRERLLIAGWTTAQKYSIDEVVKEYSKIYQSLL